MIYEEEYLLLIELYFNNQQLFNMVDENGEKINMSDEYDDLIDDIHEFIGWRAFNCITFDNIKHNKKLIKSLCEMAIESNKN